MRTQADKLKELVNKKDKKLSTRIIAITSGKGGVGKTTLSANIGYALHSLGFKVALFDADIGLANLDILLNVNSKKNILNVLKGECELKDIVVKIEDGFVLIPGKNGEEILKYVNEGVLSSFFNQLNFLEGYDFFIIDTSAGIDDKVQLFLEAADDIIVVTVPEPAALTDAYAMIKVMSNKKDLIYLLINEVDNEKQAQNIFRKMFKVALDNIKKDNFRLQLIGFLQKSKVVEISTTRRELFVKEHPHANVSIQLFNIARKIAKISERKVLDKKEDGLVGFFRRIFSNF